MSLSIRGQCGHLVFPIGPKNINLLQHVEILLPVKFHGIPLRGFREEVENVSGNQRPWRSYCLSDRSKNTNLVENNELLLPVNFNSVQWF